MVHVPHVPQGVSCEESRAAMMQVPLPRAKRLSQLSLEASRVGKRARTGREVEVGLSARWKELQCSPATRGERAQHTCQHGPFLAAPAKRRDFRGKKAFRASGPVSVSAARRRLTAGAARAPQGRRGQASPATDCGFPPARPGSRYDLHEPLTSQVPPFVFERLWRSWS